MTARFRVVHFVPDPFTGGRVPIGALVNVGGQIAVTEATGCLEHLPYAARSTVSRILAELVGVHDSRNLPLTVGPHALLGEERLVPADVTEPVEWVRKAILRVTSTSDATIQTLTRCEAGLKFLKSEQLDQFVRNNFSVDKAPRHFSRVLPSISQYAKRDSQLLFLEPVVTSTPRLHSVLKHVGTTFLAWQHSYEKERTVPRPEFIAYVLSDNGDPSSATNVKDMLQTAADNVFDISVNAEKRALIDKIRDSSNRSCIM